MTHESRSFELLQRELRDAMHELECARTELKKTAAQNEHLTQKLSLQASKLENLQKHLVRAGRKDDLIRDGDVAQRFETLKSDISQFVKQNLSICNDNRLSKSSANLKVFSLRREIAKLLYLHFFRSVSLFGLDDHLQSRNTLWKLEEMLKKMHCDRKWQRTTAMRLSS